jgi:hypothetical protein
VTATTGTGGLAPPWPRRLAATTRSAAWNVLSRRGTVRAVAAAVGALPQSPGKARRFGSWNESPGDDVTDLAAPEPSSMSPSRKGSRTGSARASPGIGITRSAGA